MIPIRNDSTNRENAPSSVVSGLLVNSTVLYPRVYGINTLIYPSPSRSLEFRL